THHMLCPCHQSTFDVTDGARVIFGPAKRPLPQLPITVDDEGYLVAAADFPEPIGPSFWDIHKDQCSRDHRDSRFPEPGPGPGTRHETRRDRWRLARPARHRWRLRQVLRPQDLPGPLVVHVRGGGALQLRHPG